MRVQLRVPEFSRALGLLLAIPKARVGESGGVILRVKDSESWLIATNPFSGMSARRKIETTGCEGEGDIPINAEPFAKILRSAAGHAMTIRSVPGDGSALIGVSNTRDYATYRLAEPTRKSSVKHSFEHGPGLGIAANDLLEVSRHVAWCVADSSRSVNVSGVCLLGAPDGFADFAATNGVEAVKLRVPAKRTGAVNLPARPILSAEGLRFAVANLADDEDVAIHFPGAHHVSYKGGLWQATCNLEEGRFPKIEPMFATGERAVSVRVGDLFPALKVATATNIGDTEFVRLKACCGGLEVGWSEAQVSGGKPLLFGSESHVACSELFDPGFECMVPGNRLAGFLGRLEPDLEVGIGYKDKDRDAIRVWAGDLDYMLATQQPQKGESK